MESFSLLAGIAIIFFLALIIQIAILRWAFRINRIVKLLEIVSTNTASVSKINQKNSILIDQQEDLIEQQKNILSLFSSENI